jgi:hypothetical protein
VPKMTPMQQAAYALDFNVSHDDLKPEVQAAYDRLLEARREAVYALESRLSRDVCSLTFRPSTTASWRRAGFARPSRGLA